MYKRQVPKSARLQIAAVTAGFKYAMVSTPAKLQIAAIPMAAFMPIAPVATQVAIALGASVHPFTRITAVSYTHLEIAALYSVSPDSLRYYEEIGLLTPRRDANGYRMYSIEAVSYTHLDVYKRQPFYPAFGRLIPPMRTINIRKECII